MRFGALLALLLAATISISCAYARHEVYWDARDEIWLADASQVKVRAAQSRVFDTSDERGMLEAVVATLQDLDFQVELLDPALGIVSGKKFADVSRAAPGSDPTYTLYDAESLVVFARAYRSWGPFWYRSDLVRLTVTVRERNQSQLIVRASAQYSLQPVEDPEPYQGFFRTLEQALFAARELAAN